MEEKGLLFFTDDGWVKERQIHQKVKNTKILREFLGGAHTWLHYIHWIEDPFTWRASTALYIQRQIKGLQVMYRALVPLFLSLCNSSTRREGKYWLLEKSTVSYCTEGFWVSVQEEVDEVVGEKEKKETYRLGVEREGALFDFFCEEMKMRKRKREREKGLKTNRRQRGREIRGVGEREAHYHTEQMENRESQRGNSVRCLW